MQYNYEHGNEPNSKPIFLKADQAGAKETVSSRGTIRSNHSLYHRCFAVQGAYI